jgi:ADP-L-glycero-D-manno-heptose 6-epimerase
MSEQNILVTGGAGFIGSALVWELNQRGIDNILVADLLGEGDKFKNLVPLRFTDYIEADELLERFLENPAYAREFSHIYHLGACSSTTETDNRYLIENNYEYTKILARAAVAHDVRFVYASSAATYGDGSQGMSDEDPIGKLRPLNMYGYSKHLFDLYAQRMGWLDHIVGLKYFNVFGPNEVHKGDMRSLVSKAFDQVMETGEIGLFKSYHPDYKDGEQKRDFLYVKDAVKMTLFLGQETTAGGLFNLGSGEANTWNTLATAIFEGLQREPRITFIDMPETLRPKYQYYTCAKIGKLRHAGYGEPITPLFDAVTDYVRNYLMPGKFLGDESA